MSYELKTYGGEHLHNVLVNAVELASARDESVRFEFNGRRFTVKARESFKTAKARAEIEFGFEILTPDEVAARASADLQRMKTESEAAIAAAGAMTDQQLRAADVPWPKTPEELSAYIKTLTDRPHDYGTCVYAMSMAAVAAFYYVSGLLGSTGFQASCADLDIIRRTRGIKGPFAIIDANQMLYPQYDIRAKVDEFLSEWQSWASEEAAKLLRDTEHAAPSVREHWEALAGRRH